MLWRMLRSTQPEPRPPVSRTSQKPRTHDCERRRRRAAFLPLLVALACAQGAATPVEPAHTAVLEQAEVALAVGEFAAARAGFAEVTRLAGEDPRGWEGLAQASVALKDDLTALEAFRELASRAGEPLRAELSLARCGAARRQAEAALAQERFEQLEQRLASPGLRACSGTQQSELALRFHLRAAAARSGSEAEHHYRRALEFEGGHEVASLGLASLLASGGRTDEALRCLSAALEIHPRSRALVGATVALLTTRGAGADGVSLGRRFKAHN